MSRPGPVEEWTDYAVLAGGGVELLHAHYRRHRYERHAHEQYAIGVTERGVQTFRYRGAEHASAAGTVMVLHDGEVHDGHAGVPEGFTYRMLYLDPALVGGVLADAFGRITPAPFLPDPLVRDPVLASAVARLHQAWASGAEALEREPLMAAVVLALYRRQPGSAEPPTVPAAGRARLERARALLDADLERDIPADELAAVTGLSRFHASRQFAQAFGLPPHAYRVQRRLAEARRQLARGEPPAAVAAAVGFADQSHLTKRFKGAFGITPGRFAAATR